MVRNNFALLAVVLQAQFFDLLGVADNQVGVGKQIFRKRQISRICFSPP